ncbi:DedA family protein [Candidatus Woesearchaeota archaeon]|nr:DedA family protein [Candidatus Woesearchaeota archaeon]
MEWIARLLEWTEKTFLPLGTVGLFLLAFIESSFFPIPPDILLLVLALADPSRAFWFATVTTVGSVLGGIFGYAIGFYGGRMFLEKFFKKERVQKVHALFEKYGSLTIFIAGLTPIPYKVFTIAAGTFYLNLKTFILASVIGRGIRFFALASFIFFFGEPIMSFIQTNFNTVSIIVSVILVLSFILHQKYKALNHYQL